jgi:hypothetical protein
MDQRYEGTGKWLIDTADFQGWYGEPNSNGLWYYGIRKFSDHAHPVGCVCGDGLRSSSGVLRLTTNFQLPAGSGKTLLTASLINYIFSLHRGPTTFCDFANPKLLEIRTVLGSYIKQVLSVFEHVSVELEGKVERLFITSPCEPSLDQLFSLLESILQLPTTTFLILDGVDECKENDRR